ncbi:unnamed protein product [Caenorhabditis angaria]|uniref:RGS domain-containing protein n=1 Tax=Caenorhabditis angaria TaxID=860376 RepID=A0A9P1I562_9PELO|nr:unnamed protein product [Caenorhabditis angaria]
MPQLSKIEELAKQVMEGAQLKTHKYFRIAVPHALTGQQIIALVLEKGAPEDDVEAGHLASLLLHHGYLFPVIEHVCFVRDDGTLYRLQRPYFWPSQAEIVPDVEYAIYLNKRLLRNEQKHGLEEDEVESFNRLADVLAHMWTFIVQQSELQLKQQKEKKKVEKVVFDSEERAFWKSRKPTRGAANYLEDAYNKTEKKIRRQNAQGYRCLMDRLRFAIKTKPWLKALKASDTMVTWVDQRADYDPFLTAPQPSNPWLTDDTSFWSLNTDTVEVPTERRVKRWGLSVQELVKDPIGRQVLETFLESEFSSENIRFWIAIQDLKYAPNELIYQKGERIREEFLAQGAPAQVNVDSRTLDQTIDCIGKAKDASQMRFAFCHSEEHVFTLMAKDSYPRFVRSQIYKGVLSAAQQQGSRRLGWRNFVFNMGATKKPTSTKPTKPQDSIGAGQPLPKQLSSDSLPVRQAHSVKPEPE